MLVGTVFSSSTTAVVPLLRWRRQGLCHHDITPERAKQQREIALDFAKKIKYIYKTQDINALANIAPYPNVFIYNYKNKKFIKIKTKEELLKLDKNVLLNRNTSSKINESFLNWSWEGFNFSHCGVLFFIENKVVMLAISLK